MTKIVLSCKYYKYLHQTNATVFITIFAIKRTKFHFLAPVLAELANLGMLFIIPLIYSARSADQQKNK